MSDQQTQQAPGYLDAPGGGKSSGRLGFFVLIGIAGILAGCQVALLWAGKSGDLSMVIGAFLVAAGGAKVGQSFAERGQ